MKLDIACGANKKEGFTGIDIADVPSVDIVHDLNVYPWPIEDESVEEIWCSHYIEHIPHSPHLEVIADTINKISLDNPISERFKYAVKNCLKDTRDGLIQFMDEIYRILKPGSKATLIAPYYASERSIGDPTHCRQIGDWTFYYYNEEWRKANKLEHYGIKANFDIYTSYSVTDELTLRNKEVRDDMIKKNWNVVNDIIAELHKN